MELSKEIGVQIEGVWLPAKETHLKHWMTASKGRFIKDGKITYQWKKQKAAMGFMVAHIPDWKNKIFVDVGAHVGLWSMWWEPLMAGVVAFEPISDMRDLFEMNVNMSNVIMCPFALGDETKMLTLDFNPNNTGNTHAMKAGENTANPVKVKMVRLDDTLPASVTNMGKEVGVLKIDCEGFEEKIVQGGLDTIKAFKPLIIVEQKKGTDYYGFNPEGAADLLKEHGYRTLKVMSGDHIMCHEDLL